MINEVSNKVKQFLKEALDVKEDGEDVRIIGIDNDDGGWIAEAEVVARNLTLPGHRLFEKQHYIVKLTGNLEVSSFKQAEDEK